MPSLTANFNELLTRIQHGRDLGSASFEPIYYLIFTPKEIKVHLDKYVIGQEEYKKRLSIAAAYHFAMIKYLSDHPDQVTVKRFRKKNTLIAGPSGSGKTYCVEVLGDLLQVPTLIVDATDYTEAGYVGKSADDMIRELVDLAPGLLDQAPGLGPGLLLGLLHQPLGVLLTPGHDLRRLLAGLVHELPVLGQEGLGLVSLLAGNLISLDGFPFEVKVSAGYSNTAKKSAKLCAEAKQQLDSLFGFSPRFTLYVLETLKYGSSEGRSKPCRSSLLQ